jgi:hypothetical protein
MYPKIRNGFVLPCLLAALVCTALAQEPPQESLWKTYITSGMTSLKQEHYPSAEISFQAALDQVQGYAENNPRLFITRFFLWLTLTEDGKSDQAKAVSDKIQPPDYSLIKPDMHSIANQLDDFGWGYEGASNNQKPGSSERAEKLREAEFCFRLAARLRQKLLPANDARLANTDAGLAYVLLLEGVAETNANQKEEGAKSYQEAIQSFTSSLNILEKLDEETKKLSASMYRDAIYQQPQVMSESANSVDSVYVLRLRAVASARLGWLRDEQKRPAEATELLWNAEKDFIQILLTWNRNWPDHPDCSITFTQLEQLYRDRGNTAFADSLHPFVERIKAGEGSDSTKPATRGAYIEAQKVYIEQLRKDHHEKEASDLLASLPKPEANAKADPKHAIP